MVPIYFLTTYSVSALSYSSSTGSLLLAVNNAVNSASRVAMGLLADRVGRQNTMVLSVRSVVVLTFLLSNILKIQVILSGVSVFALWYDASRTRFITFVVFYGILAGGYNALLPTTITEIYGVQNYATVNGFIYFIRGLGAIFGAPIAGVILGSHQRTFSNSLGLTSGTVAVKMRYNDVVVFDGILLLAAGICVSYVRWLDARDKGGWKWKA